MGDTVTTLRGPWMGGCVRTPQTEGELPGVRKGGTLAGQSTREKRSNQGPKAGRTH